MRASRYLYKENRIYIRVEFRQSFGMNKSCKCSQIICSRVHLITVYKDIDCWHDLQVMKMLIQHVVYRNIFGNESAQYNGVNLYYLI